jgi:hypothetical protein
MENMRITAATDREEGLMIEPQPLSGENVPSAGDVLNQRVTITLTEALHALTAVLKALDIPHAATVGDEEIRTKILLERVMHAAGTLERVLGDDPYIDIPWQVAYLRARLAEHPATGYKTWDERMAELDAAKAPGGVR